MIPMKYRKKFLALMVLATQSAEGRELSCEECWEQTDRFAELIIGGENAGELMPLVGEHLCRCSDCREEFAALLQALHATAPPSLYRS